MDPRQVSQLAFDERIAVARATIDYITGRSGVEMALQVPNCPGWTVYNAAVHIGRACAFWELMMRCPPEDTMARERALAAIEKYPTGVAPQVLASWGHSAMNYVATDENAMCFFSMVGGRGTLGLWAWHAASELGVHRLDVEAALGEPHAVADRERADAVSYTAEYFMPAIRRAAGEDPGRVTLELLATDGAQIASVELASEEAGHAVVRGPATQVLLAMWGRPHVDVDVHGDASVWTRWRELPGEVYQFGTWE
jgi:uncharacterized protein (TIGR03083 family)